jgi:hypothetical protein
MFLIICQTIRPHKVEDHNTKLIPFFHLSVPMYKLKLFYHPYCHSYTYIHISPVLRILSHLQHEIMVFVKPCCLVGGTIFHWNVLLKPSQWRTTIVYTLTHEIIIIIIIIIMSYEVCLFGLGTFSRFVYYGFWSFLQSVRPSAVDEASLNRTKVSECLDHLAAIIFLKTVACPKSAFEFTGHMEERNGAGCCASWHGGGGVL